MDMSSMSRVRLQSSSAPAVSLMRASLTASRCNCARPSALLLHWDRSKTTRGSVERLHADLVAQPVCIRGGALVDPVDISLELFQRSLEILELVESDLQHAPEQIVPLTVEFLESCWRALGVNILSFC